MMRRFIFVKMLKQHLMQCRKNRLLSSEGSSHLSVLNLNNFVSLLTRQVISWKLPPVFGVEQVGAVLLVFPTLMLVRAILLQAGESRK